MSIDIKCEKCGAELTVDDKFAGKKGRCPGCKAVMEIPTLEQARGETPPQQAQPQPAQQEAPPQPKPQPQAPPPEKKVEKAPSIPDTPTPTPPQAAPTQPQQAPPPPPQQEQKQQTPPQQQPAPPEEPVSHEAAQKEGYSCATCQKDISIDETFSRVGDRILCNKCYAEEFGLSTEKSGDPILDEIGLNIPGLVVLKGKEERYIGRLLQDQTARETHRRDSTTQRRKSGDLPASKRLMDFLYRKNAIDESAVGTLRNFMGQHGCSLPAAVVNVGIMDASALGELLSEETGSIFMDLDVLEINENVYSLIDHEMIRSFQVVPLSKDDDAITVALANPFDKEALDEFAKMTGLKVDVVLCSEECVKNTIERYFSK